MPILLPLIPSLISILLPAAEHALGVDAAQDDKHAWVKAAIHDMADVLLSRVKAPSWVALVRADMEKIIESELQKALEKLSG